MRDCELVDCIIGFGGEILENDAFEVNVWSQNLVFDQNS